MTFALLPVAYCLDRHLDTFGKRSLGEPAAFAHLPHKLRRIPVMDGLFTAVGQNLHDPPIGLQPYRHHRHSQRWRSRSMTELIRHSEKLMAQPRHRVFSKISRPISMRRISDVPAPIS